MVTEAPQMPPTAEFATKADLENVVHTISEELHSEIEKSENRFIKALEASEVRLRDDFTKALEDSEKRTNANISRSAKYTERVILLEIEKAKVSTLQWVLGATLTLSVVMTGSVLAAIISLA